MVPTIAMPQSFSVPSVLSSNTGSDVKRGQNLEAEAEAQARTVRFRPRPRPKLIVKKSTR